MSYYIIGLDRGSSAVKAVLLERSFRGYAFKGIRIVPVSQSGLELPSKEAIDTAVSKLVSEFPIGTVEYLTSYSGNNASVWFVPLPFSDPRKIVQTLPFELENFVPFDLDDMVLDFHMASSTVANKFRVIAALTHQEKIREELKRLKALHIDPQSILLEGDVLTLSVSDKNDAAKNVALIDVGHIQTTVSIRNSSNISFIRTISIGGLSITQSIMKTFGVSYDIAEEMKKTLSPFINPHNDFEVDDSFDDNVNTLDPFEENTTAQSDHYSNKENSNDSLDLNFDETSNEFNNEIEASARKTEKESAEADEKFASLQPKASFDSWENEEQESTLTTLRIKAPWPWGAIEQGMSKSQVDSSANKEVEAISYPEVTPDALRKVIEKAMLPLIQEIRNVLVAYEGSEHAELDSIYLLGGGALLDNFPKNLSNELGIPVSIPEQLGSDKDAIVLESENVRFAMAYALAYYGEMGGSIQKVDFRQGVFSYKKQYQSMGIYLIAALFLIGFGVISGTAFFLSNVNSLRQMSSGYDQKILDTFKTSFPTVKIDPKRPIDVAMSEVLNEHAKLVEKGKVLGLGSSKRKSIDVLKEISSSMPSREEVKIDIDDFHFSHEEVKIKGVADSFENADKVEKAIQSSAIVKETKNEVESKGSKKTFTLVISLKNAEDNPS